MRIFMPFSQVMWLLLDRQILSSLLWNSSSGTPNMISMGFSLSVSNHQILAMILFQNEVSVVGSDLFLCKVLSSYYVNVYWVIMLTR